MIQWLQSIGLSASGDFAYMTYATACVLAVMIICCITSVIFGVFTGIFHK